MVNLLMTRHVYISLNFIQSNITLRKLKIAKLSMLCNLKKIADLKRNQHRSLSDVKEPGKMEGSASKLFTNLHGV